MFIRRTRACDFLFKCLSLIEWQLRNDFLIEGINDFEMHGLFYLLLRRHIGSGDTAIDQAAQDR